jgi:predicted MFS family arabinose efflux permease
MMGVARDHLPAERSGPTIALLSVASTVGIGVGYPLAGLLTDVAGLRAAYGLGLLITTVAFAAAWWSVPQPPAGRRAGRGPGRPQRRLCFLQLPYCLVSGCSMSRMCAVPSATGRCRAPLGTTNSSPAFNTTGSRPSS